MLLASLLLPFALAAGIEDPIVQGLSCPPRKLQERVARIFSPGTLRQSVDYDEALHIFRQAQASMPRAFTHYLEGCAERAHVLAYDLERAGAESRKIFALRNPKTPMQVPLVRNGDSRQTVSWKMHVAVLLDVRREGQVSEYVIDPALFNRPVPRATWEARLASGGTSPTFQVSSRFHFEDSSLGMPRSEWNAADLERARNNVRAYENPSGAYSAAVAQAQQSRLLARWLEQLRTSNPSHYSILAKALEHPGFRGWWGALITPKMVRQYASGGYRLWGMSPDDLERIAGTGRVLADARLSARIKTGTWPEVVRRLRKVDKLTETLRDPANASELALRFRDEWSSSELMREQWFDFVQGPELWARYGLRF